MVTLLLFLVAASAAREYTDADRASFPKLFHLDEYDRCLAKEDGMYCLGTFDLTPAVNPHPTYDLMKAYSDESVRHFNRTRIHRGYCVSARCPTSDSNGSPRFAVNASELDSIASFRFERCVDRYAQARSLRASLRILNYCRTHADIITKQPPTTAEVVFTQVVFTVVLLNVIGTIYDVYYTGDEKNKNKLLSVFSIPANWRRLTVLREGGDPGLRALTPLLGIRVMAMGFTSYAHVSVLHFTFYTVNPEFLERLTQKVDGMYLSDGTSLIHTFIMMSSFLTCYNLLLFSQKREIGLHLLPLCIIKRVIRILPVHLLVVGFGASWWLHSRGGPVVPATIGLESEACQNKFWFHVFSLQNIVDAKDYCVVPTWFLAVDMHMYILACTLTLLLWRRRSTAVKVYAVLLAVSCLLTAVVAYVKVYKSMIFMATPEAIRRLFRDTASFTEFYTSSWGATHACFIGLILAHIHYELVERKIKLSDYKWYVYLHYTSIFLLFTWALTGVFVRGNHSPIFYATYMTLDRPLYSIFMAISLLGMFHIDSPVRRFYSWRGWYTLAQMSLTVMLLHWCIAISIGTKATTSSTSYFDILVDWSATNLITYVVAVPITVLVEIPAQRFLEKILF